MLRGVADSGRAAEIAMYTGNDDNIIPDLLTAFQGGLLGQWSVWTKRAVELVERAHCCRAAGGAGALEILDESASLTDVNAALFDVKNAFHGCIAGLHEILRRQGFLEGRWCLDPNEDLSPGQLDEIDRVAAAYPQWSDDEFVRANIDRWLS